MPTGVKANVAAVSETPALTQVTQDDKKASQVQLESVK